VVAGAHVVLRSLTSVCTCHRASRGAGETQRVSRWNVEQSVEHFPPRELPLRPWEERFPGTARTVAGGQQEAPADPSTLAKELARSVHVVGLES
jgi:hypothetical protein